MGRSDEFMSQITGPQGSLFLNGLEQKKKGTIAKLLSFFKDFVIEAKKLLKITTEPETVRDLVQLNLAVLLLGQKIETTFKYYSKKERTSKPVEGKYSPRVKKILELYIQQQWSERDAVIELKQTFPHLFEDDKPKANYSAPNGNPRKRIPRGDDGTYYGYPTEREFWANMDLDSFWESWKDDAGETFYSGSPSFSQVNIDVIDRTVKTTKEVEVIQKLLKRNIKIFGPVKMEIGDTARLLELWKDDSRTPPDGFYNRTGLGRSNVPYIFTKIGPNSVETIVHEATHRMNDHIKNKLPNIWDNMSVFIQDQDMFHAWVKAKVNPPGGFYSNLKGNIDRQVDEFLSQVTGPQGSLFLNALERSKPGTVVKIMNWFSGILKKIRSLLAIKQKPETVRDLVQLNLGVLLAGERIKTLFDYYNKPLADRPRPKYDEYVIQNYEENVLNQLELLMAQGKTEEEAYRQIRDSRPEFFEDRPSASYGKPTVSKDRILEQQAVFDDVISTIPKEDMAKDKKDVKRLILDMFRTVPIDVKNKQGGYYKPTSVGTSGVKVVGIYAGKYNEAFFSFLEQKREDLFKAGFTLSDILAAARYAVTSRQSKSKNAMIKGFFDLFWGIPTNLRYKALYDSYFPTEKKIVDQLFSRPTFVTTHGTSEESIAKNAFDSFTGLHTSLLVSKAKEFADKTGSQNKKIVAFENNVDLLIYAGFRGEFEAILPRDALAATNTIYNAHDFNSVDEQIAEVTKQDKKCL